jgi:hypothetical protein
MAKAGGTSYAADSAAVVAYSISMAIAKLVWHEGHGLLARVAEELRQQPLAFEISVTDFDKPPLAGETVRHRLAQFAWKAPVELTRAPTFLEKSRLFPGTTFVVGADTAERLFGSNIMAMTRF